MRVILDTNLWSPIGDEGAVEQFNLLMKARSIEVVLPPSILVEVLALPAPDARQRIISALVEGRRTRLATEAQSECLEVVSEMKRLRPSWVRSMPDRARVWSLNNFWTKRIWREALQDSQRLHEYQLGQKPVHDYLYNHQRDQRRRLLHAQNFSIRPLTAITAIPDPDAPQELLEGWPRGEPVEAWRLTNSHVYWYQLAVLPRRAVLTNEDTTLADWVGAYIDLSTLALHQADFTRFWLFDVDLAAMRRNWLRWAVNMSQTDQKITGGNAADEQHSTYLLDCDLFLSADVRYVAALKVVFDDAPFSMGEPRLVSGDRTVPILDRLIAAL